MRISDWSSDVCSSDLGQGSDDTLEGGDGDDYLVGGSGEDILQGDGGGDILLGGAESDTYRVSNGDKLIDEDGNGEVYWDNVVITGGSRKEGDPANTYYSEDKSYTYFLSNGELTVTDSAGGVITIKNYSKDNNNLGISLTDEDDDDSGDRKSVV